MDSPGFLPPAVAGVPGLSAVACRAIARVQRLSSRLPCCEPSTRLNSTLTPVSLPPFSPVFPIRVAPFLPGCSGFVTWCPVPGDGGMAYLPIAVPGVGHRPKVGLSLLQFPGFFFGAGSSCQVAVIRNRALGLDGLEPTFGLNVSSMVGCPFFLKGMTNLSFFLAILSVAV